MLVDQPTTNPFLYILSRDSHGRLRSKKPQNRAVPCELVDDIITSYSSLSRDRVQSHCMLGRDIVQCLLALLDQWRCSDGLKSFQSRVTVRADTHVFLWSILKLNFINTHQNSIHFGLKDYNISS